MSAGVCLADFDAAIFDLDGVVTRTARTHAASWKRLFDGYLQRRAEQLGTPFHPFDIALDYPRYVDGKPRYEGVESFLRSRAITLPRGDPTDPPERETVCGLGNAKNQYFRDSLQQDGVGIFDSTIVLIRRLRDRDIKTALVSSSRNARVVLAAARLVDLFDITLDGNDIARLGLHGKPAPDLFIRAAADLGVQPIRAMVFEDAISGVQAGRAGGFGLVVGIDRQDQADKLQSNGADIVVPDIADLSIVADCGMPNALQHFPAIAQALHGKQAAIFLDYDGTLTPIVARPDLAVLSGEMRRTIRELAALCTVAIVSGRDRADVQRLVGLDDLVYAGSHGFDITGPNGLHIQHKQGAAFADAVQRAAGQIHAALTPIPGALVEPKRFAVAIHYRQVAMADVAAVEAAVDHALVDFPQLRKTFGKKVFELRPRFDWDKGKAVLWLLQKLGLDGPGTLPFYLGDDTTDEDAFAAIAERGIGILVGDPERTTTARYVLDEPADVGRFLDRLAATLNEDHHD